MGRIKFFHTYNDIISLENLLEAWREFVKGKRHKRDVQEFEQNLMDNIIFLHRDLIVKTYKHSAYRAFNISDPKPRNIHKASVRDRLLHRAIYRKLYPFFDRTFIADSFSCRIGKGTHKALNRFRSFAYKVRKNNTKTCRILKCDVKKFFANINHEILKNILTKYIEDKNILWLLSQVIDSFNIKDKIDTGLPLGNLTSQLFVNIYMNELDQFMKHKLKIGHYIRYCDDFVVFSEDKNRLKNLTLPIKGFLWNRLKLILPPNKILIKTLASGLDFLGWLHFSNHRVLRTITKRRMIKRIKKNFTLETINSYLGLLRHGNAWKLRQKILDLL
jgi:retron-type reverse transcriptase